MRFRNLANTDENILPIRVENKNRKGDKKKGTLKGGKRKKPR